LQSQPSSAQLRQLVRPLPLVVEGVHLARVVKVVDQVDPVERFSQVWL
jgi:hypothetical protein